MNITELPHFNNTFALVLCAVSAFPREEYFISESPIDLDIGMCLANLEPQTSKIGDIVATSDKEFRTNEGKLREVLKTHLFFREVGEAVSDLVRLGFIETPNFEHLSTEIFSFKVPNSVCLDNMDMFCELSSDEKDLVLKFSGNCFKQMTTKPNYDKEKGKA